MGGTNYQSLLTDEGRRVHLRKVLDHRFTRQGKLSLPSLTDYNKLDTDEGLQTVGTELCRWIGLKPDGLQMRFTKSPLTHGFSVDTHEKSIYIQDNFRRHPYSCGALLVFAVIAYTMQKLDHASPDTAFIECAAIELGFGAWVINSLSPNIRWHRRIYHVIDSSWYQAETLHLQNYTNTHYVQLFLQYTRDNRISADTFLPHILKQCRYLFPEFVRTQSVRSLPESNMTLEHKNSARMLWIKLSAVSAIIALSVLLSVYVLSSTGQADTSHASKVLAAEELRKQYGDCQAEAAEKQSSYDPNDLFMTRQVDAIKSRCESLRNQYNYAVDQYQNKQ